MSIIIFDIEITGHHSEYIKHLVNYISDIKLDDNFTFIVHPEFNNTFPTIFNKAENNKNIRFIEISHYEHARVKRSNFLLRSFQIYSLMNKYAKNNEAQIVYLMVMNIFQLSLLFVRPNYQIKGILFQPFARMDKNTLKDKIKYFRKIIQTWLLVHNKKIECIFVLNDSETENFFNEKFNTTIFKTLPDPIPELNSLPDFNVRDTFNINKERKIYLHFGSLSKRKGIMEILDSFNHLGQENISNIALLVIGKASRQMEQDIKSKISLVKQEYPQAIIIYKNKFIADTMMKSFFEQCDFVLIPYKNIESSSGVLGHAISAGKPVIATNKGLLGNIVAKNSFGILLNNVDPIEIASKIRFTLINPTPKIDNQSYIMTHTPRFFAKVILEY